MLTIGRVGRSAGIRPSAIRYYERQGIVKPAVRGTNGYRFYGSDAVNVLLFIKRARALGIALKEIKPLLDLAAQGQKPCSRVKQLARTHLRDIDQKIRELKTLRNDFQSILRLKTTRLHRKEICPLIERGTIARLQ
jgi:MerR family copper efflux transcriptional regulator